MSLLYKEENPNNINRRDKLLNNSIYPWPGIDNISKDPNISTQEAPLINNKINQLLLIHGVKSILDSKFYLTKKIGQGSSGKVYLGFPKESLEVAGENEEIKYYSIKISHKDGSKEAFPIVTSKRMTKKLKKYIETYNSDLTNTKP